MLNLILKLHLSNAVSMQGQYMCECTSAQVCKYLRKYTRAQVFAQNSASEQVRNKCANAQVRKCAGTLVRKYMRKCVSAQVFAQVRKCAKACTSMQVRKYVSAKVLAQVRKGFYKYPSAQVLAPVHKCLGK